MILLLSMVALDHIKCMHSVQSEEAPLATPILAALFPHPSLKSRGPLLNPSVTSGKHIKLLKAGHRLVYQAQSLGDRRNVYHFGVGEKGATPWMGVSLLRREQWKLSGCHATSLFHSWSRSFSSLPPGSRAPNPDSLQSKSLEEPGR